MKILTICSKNFYSEIEKVKEKLVGMGHEVFMPNCYDDPGMEEKFRQMGEVEHREFKARMFKQSQDTIRKMDAVLVLNYDKEKEGKVYENYIGGATFLEMYDAFCMGKKIFMMNPIPQNILYDEIEGFSPLVLNGDLSLVGNARKPKEEFDLENYLMWLASFSETFPEFYDDSSFDGDAVVTQEDRENKDLLYELYQILEERAFDWISDNCIEQTIKFKFDSVGYEISCIWDEMVSYKLNRVVLNNNNSDYFDIEEILYGEPPKKHVYKQK